MATRRVHTRVVPSAPLQGMVHLQRAIVSCYSVEGSEVTVLGDGLFATGELLALEAPARPGNEPALFKVIECLPVVVGGEPRYEARLERVDAHTARPNRPPSMSSPAISS